jgi:hypothetical protein
MGVLSEQFLSEDRSRHSDWLRQQRWFIKARQETERRADIQVKRDDDFTAFASEVIMATDAQIKAFEVKLDSYDQATVAALQENGELLEKIAEQLALVRQEKQVLLDQAYVMEDGRRVFRAQDGSFVIDEEGQSVGQDEVDFELVEGPDAETYMEILSAEAALQDQQELALQERDQIHAFQEKSDAAREQIAQGDMSEADLEALDAELLDLMPDTVRAHVPGLDPRAAAPNLTVEFKALSAMPLAQAPNAETSAPAPLPFQ